MQRNPINLVLAAAVVALSILAFTRPAGAGMGSSGEVACACSSSSGIAKCCCATAGLAGPEMNCR
jgi:hypothetical protein